MTGSFALTPDPPYRGDTTTVTLTGGTAGPLTVNFTDGVHSVDMPCQVSSEGTGTVQWTVPSNWGATLTISAPGFYDFNTAVG